MDRKARAEGRPQDATPEVPMEGWSGAYGTSNPALQEVERALHARGSQLEKRIEEEMAAFQALCSEAAFLRSV